MTSHAVSASHAWSASQSVLHVITCLDVGGAELALKRLILGDPLAGSRHTVVSLREIGPVGHELIAAGVQVHALRMGRPLTTASAVFRLARVIERVKPSVIQTWMYHADLVGGLAARVAGRKEVIWGIRQTGFASGSSRLTRAVMRLCASLSSRIPRLIVCCAEAARDSHAAWGYDERKMRVIPNGFELPDLSHVPGSRNALRAQLGVPRECRVIGMVARFDPLKNHRGFIQAARLVARRNDTVHFMLVGRHVDLENAQLMRWIHDARLDDRIHLLGERRDIEGCLASMDVFCLPSIHEAFPNVLGEAMAMALPCVVTDVGDAACIVGDAGWVVRAGDGDQLASVLVDVISLPDPERIAVGQSARRRIASQFSLTRTRQMFEQVYADACRQG